MRVDKEWWGYILIRIATFPFAFFPISWIHKIGNLAGLLSFYLFTRYRKRTLSNLALATDLAFPPAKRREIAKQAFQNLAITCLEYPKFAWKKDLSSIIQCENPEVAQSLHEKGQGIIFFCGHQANWETLFLDATSRMKGVAIGRPIPNKRLYQWIISMREKFGGKIIEPRKAIREGIRALRKGLFIGIVGDQGKPDSDYHSPFFGRRAWTSPAPVYLAYKTRCPILLAETRRVPGGYRIRYSDPIWPDPTQPIEEEIDCLMKQMLHLFEESIKRAPGQWLWQHARWKQPDSCSIRRACSHDSVCIILPPHPEHLLPHLPLLKRIYQHHFLTLIAPQGTPFPIDADEVHFYTTLSEACLPDHHCKLLFNFTSHTSLSAHYKHLSAIKILDLPTLTRLASPHLPSHLQNDLSEVLKRALCRPGDLWHAH